MTRRALPSPPAGSGLLLGRLLVMYLHDEVTLFVEGWCPCCGQRHRHRWRAEDGLNALVCPTAHCDRLGGPARENYVVGLDPALDRESRQILDRFSHSR